MGESKGTELNINENNDEYILLHYDPKIHDLKDYQNSTLSPRIQTKKSPALSNFAMHMKEWNKPSPLVQQYELFLQHQHFKYHERCNEVKSTEPMVEASNEEKESISVVSSR